MSKVVIIILNWNKWQDTIDCLNSVYKSDYSNFEVLLIDNASSDGSVEIIKAAFPDLRMIVNSENIGFTGGNNQGMRLAVSEGADYVWLLNNDTVVDSNCLSKIVYVASSNESVGLVSPAICYYDYPHIHQFKGNAVDWDHLEIDWNNKEGDQLKYHNGDNVCLWGTALLVSANLIKKIGVLNESYFAYAEDAEFSLRSLLNGFKNIYEPDVKIYHKNEYLKKNYNNSYYYYYIIRNNYFLWSDIMNFKYNRDLMRRTAHVAIFNAKKFESLKMYDYACVCVQAFFDAVLNKRGKFKVSKLYQYGWVKFLLMHPYFIINLLFLDVKSIIKQIIQRLKFDHG